MKSPFVLFITVLAAPALHAASISWGAATAVTTSTEISTNGVVFEAWNVNGADKTINGVTFSAANINITTDFNSTHPDFWDSGLTADPAGPDGVAYREALDDARWGGAPTTGIISISNLTVGNIYEVQVWNADTRGCCNNRGRVFTAGNSVTVNSGSSAWALGTFTADATTQNISVFEANGPQLNLIQVRTLPVPEPSAALLGLGALGLGLRRRRA